MEEQMKNDEMEIDLIELFHVLLKKAWVILLCLIIGAVAAGGYTKLFVTPQYQATSTLYVLGNSVKYVRSGYVIKQAVDGRLYSIGERRPVMKKVNEEAGKGISV